MRRFNFVFILIAAAIGVHRLAAAAPALEQANYARFYGPEDPRALYVCQNLDGAPCQGSAFAPGTNWEVDYLSYGSADWGILKGYAKMTVSGDNSLGTFPSFASIGSRAGFLDSLTFSGGTGEGLALLSFAVDGHRSRSGGAVANSLLQLLPYADGQPSWPARNHGVVNGVGTVPVHFVFDQPAEFLLYFYALAQEWSWHDGDMAESDYSHTAILNSISVFDSAGMPVLDFSIESASGTHYSAQGVVPVAPTWALLLPPALLLVVAKRRAAGRRKGVSG